MRHALLRIGYALSLVAGLCSGLPCSGHAQTFLPDDPLWNDPDRLDLPLPERREARPRRSPFNILIQSLGLPGEHSGPAVNVNTLGEVPTSSWFTHRPRWRAPSRALLVDGAALSARPDTAAPLRVLSVETRHNLVCLHVRDARDRTFRLVFDSPRAPELATGAAMMASRFFHAFGYFVPEHGLMQVRPAQFVPAPDSGITRAALHDAFQRAARDAATGHYRALVTHLPDAMRDLGPFRFHGTRPDDANDVFPHEARRELRGLRVFAAWLNHSTVASTSTLAAIVQDGEAQYVRHYLRHFETTLGSAGDEPKMPWSGHEHLLELSPVLLRMGTLGLAGGRWMEATTPKIPGVGHFEAEHFRARAWRVEIPNPAFERCDADDAFWAARSIAALSDEDLAAVVATAQFSDPRAGPYLVRTLARRRRVIAATYLHHGGGLDRIRITDGALAFDDLHARHPPRPKASGKRGISGTLPRIVQWRVFHNATGQLGKRLGSQRTRSARFRLPPTRVPYLQATIRTPGLGQTHVYLRQQTPDARPGYSVVGIERHGPEAD